MKYLKVVHFHNSESLVEYDSTVFKTQGSTKLELRKFLISLFEQEKILLGEDNDLQLFICSGDKQERVYIRDLIILKES